MTNHACDSFSRSSTCLEDSVVPYYEFEFVALSIAHDQRAVAKRACRGGEREQGFDEDDRETEEGRGDDNERRDVEGEGEAEHCYQIVEKLVDLVEGILVE